MLIRYSTTNVPKKFALSELIFGTFEEIESLIPFLAQTLTLDCRFQQRKRSRRRIQFRLNTNRVGVFLRNVSEL